MSVINIVGQPGAGKTVILAELLLQTLEKYEKIGLDRRVYSNIHLADEYERHYARTFHYWTDVNLLSALRDCDIFIDEIAGYFNSRDWENMPVETREWLFLHEHYGVELICCTQSWKTIDISFRRLTSQLLYLEKWFGNKRPTPTNPTVRFVYGLLNMKNVSRKCFDKEDWEFEFDDVIGEFRWISRKKINYYNTLQKVEFNRVHFAKHVAGKVCLTCGWHSDEITHR